MPRTNKQRITRPLLALSMAASIALSPLAVAPAQAGGGGGNNGQLLAGLVALGLIGVIIENEAGRRSNNGYHQGNYSHVPHTKRLPASCLKTYRTTRHQTKTLFSQDCLSNYFPYWRSMPATCGTTIRYRNSRDRLRSAAIFKPGCLSNWGYHIVERY